MSLGYGSVPSGRGNGFGSVNFTGDEFIYDPFYILKFKNPNLPFIVKRINELAVAVTSLQMAVTSLVNEGNETRGAVDKVTGYVRSCCDHAEIDHSSIDGSLWDGSGILQEGIDAYSCHIRVE